jgi:multicomponent Na+:H+ antiporter subunit D
MLSGIVIQSGFFAMVRTLLIFSGTSLTQNFGFTLAIFGLITMTVGNLMALVQTDLKRMLAYSSVTQMGYILVGIGLAFEFGEIARAGLEGGLFHILTHAFMKGLAFLCAGAIIYRVGTRDIRKMKGIGRTMPLTALAFAIAGLSLAGVPPLSGFMSKWLIYKVGLDIGGWGLFFTGMAVFNSILSLGYYLPAINTFFFAKETLRIVDPAVEFMLGLMGGA